MSNLKGKVFVIIFDKRMKEAYSEAAFLYQQLYLRGFISVLAADKNDLIMIQDNGYDLRYVFLESMLPIPTKEQEDSIYHMHDVTNHLHFWLDDFNSVDKVLDNFERVELELIQQRS
jgi:hypothetical protein